MPGRIFERGLVEVANLETAASTKLKTIVHLIPHAETTANAARCIAGVTDVPLTARGRAQAAVLAERRFDGNCAVVEVAWSGPDVLTEREGVR